MYCVSNVNRGHPHPASSYTFAAPLRVTVHVFGCIVSSPDPVETRGRLWSQLEDLLAGGGRMTGSVARGEQFEDL